MANPAKQAIIDRALNHVYTDLETYVRDIAREHTVANMGQDLEWLMGSPSFYEKRPETLISGCYNQLRNDCESDEMADGIHDEYRSWVKDARRDAAIVQKNNLSLTIANAMLAFERKIS